MKEGGQPLTEKRAGCRDKAWASLLTQTLPKFGHGLELGASVSFLSWHLMSTEHRENTGCK